MGWGGTPRDAYGGSVDMAAAVSPAAPLMRIKRMRCLECIRLRFGDET